MNKNIGKGATVIKPKAITKGRTCVIIKYYKETKKYEVMFDEEWIGWYTLDELNIDE
jgi:hypothetical protein